MGTWKYIGVLTVFVAGVAGYAYAEPEVLTVVVTDKYINDVQMRRGRPVVATDEGDFPILKFPLIGYIAGAKDVYAAIVPGTSMQVRVAQWPTQKSEKAQFRITFNIACLVCSCGVSRS